MEDAPQIDPTEPLTAPRGLWAAYYLTFFLHLSLLAAVVTMPGREAVVMLAGWTAAFGLIGGISWAGRVLIHDTLAALTLRERLALGFFTLSTAVTPIFFGGSILRDGPLFVTSILLLLAVNLAMANRLLAATLLAGWIGAYWCETARDLLLLAGFAASWFFAAGMTRLASIADQYGVWPGYPVARLARATAVMSLPALLAGGLAWLAWPRSWAEPGWSARGSARPVSLGEMPAATLGELMNQLVILAMLVAVFIVVLYLLRRWLLRRRKAAIIPGMAPGQEIELDYSLKKSREPGPTLPGLRGAIVRLWSQWERSLAHEGLGRRKGETADEFAARLAAENAEAAPAAEVSRLLDLAHYSAANLKQSDVEKMRGLVNEELARQSMRVQGPAEELE